VDLIELLDYASRGMEYATGDIDRSLADHWTMEGSLIKIKPRDHGPGEVNCFNPLGHIVAEEIIETYQPDHTDEVNLGEAIQSIEQQKRWLSHTLNQLVVLSWPTEPNLLARDHAHPDG